MARQAQELRDRVNEAEDRIDGVLENQQPELTEEDVNRMLAEARQKRIQLCVAEVNAVLSKYECKLTPVAIIVDGQIMQRVDVTVSSGGKG